jgi:DNA-3-methyladenine glycosylase
MSRPGKLTRSFYARPVLQVARDCLGKILVHQCRRGTTSGRIVEAEAYRGPEDRAAHSWRGHPTPRTRAMFGPPGHAYVFFVYGMHWHFNLVTGKEGDPHAVLIRAVEPLEGLDLMATRRGVAKDRVELTNGPGKLCQALGIDREQYGADLCGDRIYLLDAPRSRSRRTPRIGVDYAGAWALEPWRFFEPENRYVSPVRDWRGARG